MKKLVLPVVLAVMAVAELGPIRAATFRFTASADNRPDDAPANLANFQWTLDEMTRRVGGEGVFHIMPGDFDGPAATDSALAGEYGRDVVWYPIVGNHETETPADMTWVRNFYPALPSIVRNGPPGCETTTYSFDHGNAHFIALNQYYNGTSDVGTNGDVVDALYNWLEADLLANNQPVVFVLGHEPAYPQVRHVGDSLDLYSGHRDRFWKLLNDHKVVAYLCGHTHVYSALQQGGGDWEAITWQIDLGNSGNPSFVNNPQTFLDITVTDQDVIFDTWQGMEGQPFTLTYSWTVPVPGMATTVTLDSPADQEVVTDPAVSFVCSAEDPAGLSSASLYLGEAPHTVVFSGPDQVHDAALDSGSPTVNLGADASINVDGLTPHAHAVLKVPGLFGTGPGEVPPGATIASATLRVNVSNLGNQMSLYRLTEDWDESEVTWNERVAGTSWTDAGGDGATSHAAQALAADCSATGWRTFDLTPFAQEWSDGAANYGILMVDGGTDGVDFGTSESASPPVVAITYGEPMQLMETQTLSGPSATWSFSPIDLQNATEYAWNCLVRNVDEQGTWAPEDARFTVDPDYPDYPLPVFPLDTQTGVSLPVTLQVTVSDPNTDDLDVEFYGRQAGLPADPFTLVVLPDTQMYVATETLAPLFTQQTQWITDNAAGLNIVFASHLGDIVDTYNDATQWVRAKASMGVLHGVVPYGLLPGNHDQPTALYNLYFPYTDYAGVFPWYGGHSPVNGNDNSYQLFSAAGDDYLLLHLQNQPPSDVITWADARLQQFARRKAILVTHRFLTVGGAIDTAEAQAIWDQLVVPHDNVYFILCGHHDGEYARTDLVNGRPVHQLLSDYQGREKGGEGWLRTLRFVPQENKVYVQTYSPYLEAFEADANSEFVLDFNMGDYALVGEAHGVPSGSTASSPWPDLVLGAGYEWYAQATDPTARSTRSASWSFQTASSDTVPPVLSGITVVEVTDRSARILWSTDEPADSRVDYGTSTTYDLVENTDTRVTAHGITLPNLTSETVYHYQVTSRDAWGNSATSSDSTFVTLLRDDPPTAKNDSYSVPEDQELVVDAPAGVLANDTDDHPLELLTAVLLAGPTHGALTLNPDGSFVYTPGPEFNGTDSFTYHAHDGTWGSENAATVGITVTAVNDAPTVPPGLTATAGSGIVSLSWGAAADVDGDPITYAVYRSTISGSYDIALTALTGLSFDDHTVNNGTTYFYTVTATDGGLESSPSDEVQADPQVLPIYAYATQDPEMPVGLLTGAFSATFSADGLTQDMMETGNAAGSQFQATYTLRPTLVPSQVSTMTISWSATWTDGDAQNEFVAVHIWNRLSGVWVDISAAFAEGEITPGNPQDYLAADGALLIRFSDSGLLRKEKKDTLSMDALYAVLVDGPPNYPPVASDESYPVTEDTLLSVAAPGILAHAEDSDGDALTAVLADNVASGALALNGDGSFVYTPDPDFFGMDGFTYTVSDGWSHSQVATVSLVVSPVNDAPVAGDDGYNLLQDTPLQVAAPGVLENDSDVDGDALTATLGSGPEHGVLNAFNQYGAFDYTPSADFLGEDSFTYTIDDGSGSAVEAAVTITVTAQPTQSSVFVQDISLRLTSAGKNIKAEASVLVYTPDGPAAGAAVSGDWYYQDGLTQSGSLGTTDTGGTAILTSPPEKARGGERFRFVVTDVVLSGRVYTPADNQMATDVEIDVP